MKFLLMLALVASAQALTMSGKALAAGETDPFLSCVDEGHFLCTHNLVEWGYNEGHICCPDGTVCIWNGNGNGYTLDGCVNSWEYAWAERTKICPKETFWKREDRLRNPLRPEQGCREDTCNGQGYCCDGYATNGCKCPHPEFLEKHVCDWCQNKDDALRFTTNTWGRDSGRSLNTVFTDYDTHSTRVVARGKRNYCLHDAPLRAFVFEYDAYEGEWEFSYQKTYSPAVHNPENSHFVPNF